MDGSFGTSYRIVGRVSDDACTPEQASAIDTLASSLRRLNQAVARAVDTGVTVELTRAARYHDAKGHWGDQMCPVIRPPL